MGACASRNSRQVKQGSTTGGKQPESPYKNQYIKTDEKQLHCLKLIYQDLVSRTPDKKMNSKIFEMFFHLNPMWGGSLFRKFTKQTNNNITEEIFIQAILRNFKQGPEQKLKFLFCLYDLDESQGVSFNQLLAILLSSPQEQLKQVLTNDSFLQYLTVKQMSYYLMNSKKRDMQKQEKQYKSNLSLFPYLPIRKRSSSVEQDLHLVSSVQANLDLNKKNNFISSNAKQSDSEQQNEKIDREAIQQEFKNNLNKSMYTTQILRKYTQFLFKKFYLNKQNGQVSYQQFKTLVKSNPKIYRQCFQGFHQYLWLHENGVPMYQSIEPIRSGYCTEKYQGAQRPIFLVFIKNSLMIFDNQVMERPVDVKNLEGLNIQAKQNGNQYGFVLKHQDGFYPQKQYYFFSKEEQQIWLEKLCNFQEKDVFDKYKLEQKIGQGSFCDVFKGICKQSGQKRAIKIFDKQKRTQVQINAVNSQSQMLATAVMTNVVRAYQRFQSKHHIYIILQLLQGGTLYQYVKKRQKKSLSEDQAMKLMRSLLQTIKKLHDIGIIHRDLKLENILMKQQNGQHIPKIIDFGLAIYKIDLVNIEDMRKYVGTPNFVPPQIFLHQQYDETIDVFSLGVIMHFMLTGSLPFHASKINDVYELTMECHINYEAKKWKNVSNSAKQLLAKLICYRNCRITASQALEHQWFKEMNPE